MNELSVCESSEGSLCKHYRFCVNIGQQKKIQSNVILRLTLRMTLLFDNYFALWYIHTILMLNFTFASILSNVQNKRHSK